jgi:hypothetical protein
MRLVHLRDVSMYQRGLRELEADISYPIDNDRFRIDHGDNYAKFFERMGQAHFLLALDGERVVGTFAGVGKTVQQAGKRAPAVYGGDWKIAPDWRGGQLAPKFFWSGLRNVFDGPSWRLVYVAAMRGRGGDVTRSFKGISPLRLGKAAARLAVYFAQRETILMMSPKGCPKIPPGGLELSPDAGHRGGITTTAGCKDLILESTGKPWPLWHLPLGPSRLKQSFGRYLYASAKVVPEGASLCFALDERLEDIITWLDQRGIAPGATCTIYMFRLPFAPRPEPWVHLATSEI